jgi:hypothetical protein
MDLALNSDLQAKSLAMYSLPSINTQKTTNRRYTNVSFQKPQGIHSGLRVYPLFAITSFGEICGIFSMRIY